MTEQGFLFPEAKDLHIKLAVERVKDALRFSEHLGLGSCMSHFRGARIPYPSMGYANLHQRNWTGIYLICAIFITK